MPRKNLQLVGGIALVARGVQAAAAAASVDRVIVSTDDVEIADVARRAGADVIERPTELATDTASTESALLHVLGQLEAEASLPDVLLLVQCTTPFTTSAAVESAARIVLDGEADTAFTAAPFHHFVWRSDGGSAVGVNHDASVRLRRQDMEPEWLEDGGVYAMRVDGFREKQHRFFGRIGVVGVDPGRVIEIDEPGDLVMARIMATSQWKDVASDALPDSVGGLALDFDGVFTDDGVITHQDGSEAVRTSRRDGLGLAQLRRRADVALVVISKERNPVVAARCAKLDLDCLQGVDDKLPTLTTWASERRLDLADVVYLGNDINDVACLRAAGCGVVVADADPRATEAADIVLSARGGHGAIRELTELILESGKFHSRMHRESS